MRVIAGSARGRRLKSPRARTRVVGPASVRPSSDLMRGAIFSSLASLGADIVATSPEETAAIFKADIAKYTKVAQATNIKAE